MTITAFGGTASYNPLETSTKTKRGSASGGVLPNGSGQGGASRKLATGGSSGANSDRIHDPQDLHQDGVVSYKAKLLDDLQHPAAAKNDQSTSLINQNYNQQDQTAHYQNAVQSTADV